MKKTTSDWAEFYTSKMQWGLVSIPAGSKAPKSYGWQQVERALVNSDQAVIHYEQHPTFNMGLLHSASGTCAIDIDDVERTKQCWAALGIDYDAILAAGPQIVGRSGRAKVIFKCPDTIKSRVSLSWPNIGVIFELRAGSTQDVLPPSIHPDTGMPYEWAGRSLEIGLPELPQQLRVLWENWKRFKPQMEAIDPNYVDKSPTMPAKPRPAGTSVIDRYNQEHNIHMLLQAYGYKRTAKNRYLSPRSTSGLSGVSVFEDNTAYSHHASDPFDSAHSFDAFELFCQYEHAGDVQRAVREAAQLLEMESDSTFEYDKEAINHGAKVAQSIMGNNKKSDNDIPDHLLTVPGILNEVVTFYATTAPKEQPQFAVQAALALGAVAMGRRWRSCQQNYSALYFINVAKSAAGKEHAKTVIERCLEHAGLDKLIGPGGYTSSAGVFSSLVNQPNHIAIIDELGRVLASSQAAGNQHKADSHTTLMEVFGRQAATLRQIGYAKTGLTKSQAADLDKIVKHPSLTLLGMTTPSTLYDSLSSRYVSDGFLGRFLIVESHRGRQMSRIIDRDIEPGERLINWLNECASSFVGDIDHDSYDNPPNPVVIPFSKDCHKILQDIESYMIERMNENDKIGLESMFGRTREIIMRVALIIARSKEEDEISTSSLKWARDYVTFYAERTVDALSRIMADGDFERISKAVYSQIEQAGLAGMSQREIARKVKAFANLDPKRRKDVMDVLVDDYGIASKNRNENKKGRPNLVWFAAPNN